MCETDYAYLCTKQKPLTNQTASMKAQRRYVYVYLNKMRTNQYIVGGNIFFLTPIFLVSDTVQSTVEKILAMQSYCQGKFSKSLSFDLNFVWPVLALDCYAILLYEFLMSSHFSSTYQIMHFLTFLLLNGTVNRSDAPSAILSPFLLILLSLFFLHIGVFWGLISFHIFYLFTFVTCTYVCIYSLEIITNSTCI